MSSPVVASTIRIRRESVLQPVNSMARTRLTWIHACSILSFTVKFGEISLHFVMEVCCLCTELLPARERMSIANI